MISSALTSHALSRAPQPPVPPTGHESPSEARDAGWLGQVPPPSPPAPACPPAATQPPTYANPQLAPEPWKADEPLFPSDPTLFG
jgi:hypothetical protein